MHKLSFDRRSLRKASLSVFFFRLFDLARICLYVVNVGCLSSHIYMSRVLHVMGIFMNPFEDDLSLARRTTVQVEDAASSARIKSSFMTSYHILFLLPLPAFTI